MIYIVTYGEYSAYGIVGATTDRTIAEQLAQKFTKECWSEECRIEEYPDAEIMLKPAWSVYFDHSGNVACCDLCVHAYQYQELDQVKERYGYHNPYEFVIRVLADTAEAAIKIASEKRAKYLAEKNGL